MILFVNIYLKIILNSAKLIFSYKNTDNRSYTVGQNYIFFKKRPSKRWGKDAMRLWFKEVQNMSPLDYDSLPENKGNNFTQMIWADAEFIGCAGALMFDGFLATCYYHPKGNIPNEAVFMRGLSEEEICSNCEDNRSSCSRILTGLCGLGNVFIKLNVSHLFQQLIHSLFLT